MDLKSIIRRFEIANRAQRVNIWQFVPLLTKPDGSGYTFCCVISKEARLRNLFERSNIVRFLSAFEVTESVRKKILADSRTIETDETLT